MKESFWKFTAFIWLFAASIWIHHSSEAKSAGCGGGCGGGGSTIRLTADSQPILIDLFTLNPSIKPVPMRKCQVSGKKVGLQLAPFNLKDEKSFGLAKARLDAWEKTSPALVHRIRGALDRMTYSLTDSTFREIPKYDLPEAVKDAHPFTREKGSVQTAILYVPRYGSIISAPAWKCLDEETRAGLLIHEALRQIQSFYENFPKPKDRFSDEQLQWVTAKIISGSPKGNETLETQEALGARFYTYCVGMRPTFSPSSCDCEAPASSTAVRDFYALIDDGLYEHQKKMAALLWKGSTSSSAKKGARRRDAVRYFETMQKSLVDQGILSP